MIRATTLWMVLATALAACGDDDDDHHAGDGDADADVDADTDADTDADADGDADGDADAGPCGGTASLTVRVLDIGWRTALGDPLAEAVVALDCGDTRLDGVTDAAGEVVFDGLDLDTTPVDVTAFHPDTNAVTLLGVRDASEPLQIALTPLAYDPEGLVRVGGDVLATEPDSLTFLSISNGGYLPFEDAYEMMILPQDNPRFTGLEVRPEEDGSATPLAWFDAAVPMPADGEGPDLALAPTTFATADVEVTFHDDRLAVRQVPLDDSPLGYSSRHLVGALLYDMTESRDAWNFVGMTMSVDTVGDTDTYHVAWPEDAVTRPLTRLHILSEDVGAGAFARTEATPDALGPLDAPELPTLVDVLPDEPWEVRAGEIAIDRPDWADGATVLAFLPRASSSLWAPGYMGSAYWIIVSSEPLDAVRVPAPPGQNDFADVLTLRDLQLLVQVSDAVDVAEGGITWTAVDARYTAFAP